MANEFKIKKGLIVTGADGGTVVDIQGSQGQLFSVTDDLSGSIFAVSDISGVPILDVNSSGTVTIDGLLTGGEISILSPNATTGQNGKLTIYSYDDGDTDVKNLQLTVNNGGDANITNSGPYLNLTALNYIKSNNVHIFNEDMFMYGGKYIRFLDATSPLDSWNRTLGVTTSDVVQVGGIAGYNTGKGQLALFSNNVQAMFIDENQKVQFNAYDSTNNTGTPTYLLGTDASGNVVKTNTVPGSGAGPYLPLAGGTMTGGLIGTTATFSGLTTLETFPQTQPIRGEVYSIDPHNYVGGVSYWTWTKIAQLDADGHASLRYNCKADINYPHVAVGWVTISSFNASTISISHQQIIPSETIQPQVWLDNNRDVWIRMVNASWTTNFQYNWEVVDPGVATIYDGTTQSNTQPANSTVIEVGQEIKFPYTNAAAPVATATYIPVTTTGNILARNGNITLGGTGRIQGVDTVSATTDAANKLYVDNAVAAVPIGNYLPLSAGSGSPLTGTLYGTSTNFTGSATYAGSMVLGNGASTAEAWLQIGQGRTGNGYSYIDLIGDATYTDYGLRIIRNNTGANTNSAIIHRGTGNLEIATVESASVLFKTGNTSALTLTNTQNAIFDGYVGIGTTTPVETLTVPSGEGVMLGYKRFYSDTGQVPAGIGSAYALTANLNTEQGTTLTSKYQYKFYLTTTGTGTYNSSVYIVYRNSADTAWDVHRVSSTGLSSNHPELTLSSTSALIYNDHPSAYNVSYRVETSYTGQAKTSPQIFGSDYMWTRDNTDLYYMDGDVGIGTTSPFDSRLEVAGKIRAAGGTSGGYFFGSEEFDGGFYAPSDGNLAFATNNAERIRIDSNGNLGIGTTSPGEKLDIVGKQIFSGTGTSHYGNPASFNTASNGDKVIFYNNGTSYDGRMGVGSTSNLWLKSYGETANEGDIEFYAGGSNRAIIKGSGNVGIGTTAPGEKLTVSGDGRFSNGSQGTLTIKHNYGYLQPNWGIKLDGDTNTSGGYLSQYVNLGGFALNQGGTYYGGGPHRTDANSTSFSSVSGVSGVIAFYTNTSLVANTNFTPSERMRINSAGNVGIGTTNPSYKLDIEGSSPFLRINNTAETDAGIIFQDTADAGQSAAIKYNSSDNSLSFSNFSSSVERMRIDSAGNVGIGTTSPNAKLDVQGTQGQLFSVTDDLSGDIFSVADISGVPILNVNSSGLVTVDGTSYFNGNVGINTASPSAKLDVNGDIIISDSGDRVFATDSLNGAFELGDIDALIDEAVIQGDGAFIFLKNAGNTTLTTTVDNRVGIGTSSPGSKLDIVGATNESNSSLLRVRTTDNPNAPEKVVGFYVNTNTERGFISVNQYSTAYSTSSDYRLKENIVPISNSIERLKELKPCRFNFIQGDPNYVVDGFIAHEAAEVIPEAVTGEKDAIDEDNNPLYQGIDQSKVVPLLTAALQEAISKIEQLETRIQTLENN